MDKVTYLSYFLDESTPAYGGVTGAFVSTQTNSIINGDTSNNLKFTFPNHLGTHIDFPRHFNTNGKTCSDYPASFWVFNRIGFLSCKIDEVPSAILEISTDIELLILKTGFGSERYNAEYWMSQPVIPATFASLFKTRFPFLRVFGFDLLSLTSKLNRTEGKVAHLKFLIEQDILILEDMDIRHLHKAPEKVIILPLQVHKADGSPCTVIAC